MKKEKRIMATNASTTKAANPCKLLTGNGILSYAYIFDPAPNNLQSDQDNKYSTHLLIDKNDAETLTAIKASMMAAVQQGIGKTWGGSQPGKLLYPIHDGDEVAEKKGEIYKGKFYLNCSNYKKPKVVDRNKQPIEDSEEVYSGCVAWLVMLFKPYNNVNKGITCRLLGVQKVADGTPLGGGTASDDDFADLSDDADGDGDLPFTLPGETEEEALAAMKAQAAQQQAQKQAPPKSAVDDLLGDMNFGVKANDFAA
jgi:hypothetical protein